MTREVILLLLRCLNTEPELCGPAVEAATRDPQTRAFAERLVAEAATVSEQGRRQRR